MRVLPEDVASWERRLRAAGRKPTTVATYRKGVETFLTWCERNSVDQTLAPETVFDWIDAMQQVGNRPATIRTHVLAVKRFSKWLASEDDQDDPLRRVQPPTAKAPRIEFPTDAEMDALFKVCDGKLFVDRRDLAVIRFLASTGARASECLRMTTDDLNLDERVALLRHTKSGEARTVTFSPKTEYALDRYLRARRTHKRAKDGALWLGANSGTFGYKALYATLQVRSKAAGIRPVRPHVLRHYWAHSSLSKGVSTLAVQASGGWSDARMLSERYGASLAQARAVQEFQAKGWDE